MKGRHMTKSKRAAGIAATAAVALALTTLTAPAAMAVEAEHFGFTKSEFIAATTAQGVDPTYAEAVWGNEDAMLALPVSSTEAPVATAGQLIAAPTGGSITAAAATEITTTHYKKSNNAVGIHLWTLKVIKHWKANGLRVAAVDAVVETDTNGTLGWSFSGISNKYDRYSTEGNRVNGGHTSYRAGNFQVCTYLIGCTTITAWVKIKGLWNGSYVKSSGGG